MCWRQSVPAPRLFAGWLAVQPPVDPRAGLGLQLERRMLLIGVDCLGTGQLKSTASVYTYIYAKGIWVIPL